MSIEKWIEQTIARWVNGRTRSGLAQANPGRGLGFSLGQPGQSFEIPIDDRLRHTYILGSTGSGKTNLLIQLVDRDIAEKRSVVILDMRGDLVDRVISRHADQLDAEKLNLIDLRNAAISSGLNPFQSGHDPHGAALHVHSVLRSAADSWGVQLDETLRCSPIALSYARRSLADLPKLLGDARYRGSVLPAVSDGQVTEFFARFEQLSADRQIAWTLPVLNKVSAFLSHPTIRAILQDRSPLDPQRVLDDPGSITLVALAADRLHGLAGVFGCLVVSTVENAAMSRVNTPEALRNPVHLYLDEFENFQSPAFESIIAEGRRFRLGLTLSHQNLHQLDAKLRHTITNNAATRIYFRTGHVDAKELGSELEAFRVKDAAKKLLRLPVGEAYVIGSGSDALHIAFHVASRDSASSERIQALLGALEKRTAPTIAPPEPSKPIWVKHVRTPPGCQGQGRFEVRLEERDCRVLAEVFLSKVIRRDDLIAFGFFTSVPRCNARLLALKQEGLLKSRSELGGMELRAALYHFTSKGVRIAADVLDISPDGAIEIHRSGIRELAIKHALRCSDLRTRFIRELAGDAVIRLASWSQELLCHHEFQIGDRVTVIKPDALAELHAAEGKHHVFIEVDLGNAAIPKVMVKLHRFQTYADSGAFREAYEAGHFSVLLVTTDERRLAHLRRLGRSQALILSTWKRLAEHGLRGSVYATPERDLQPLSEVIQ